MRSEAGNFCHLILKKASEDHTVRLRMPRSPVAVLALHLSRPSPHCGGIQRGMGGSLPGFAEVRPNLSQAPQRISASCPRALNERARSASSSPNRERNPRTTWAKRSMGCVHVPCQSRSPELLEPKNFNSSSIFKKSSHPLLTGSFL